MTINKHLPSDIQKLSKAELIDIYHVHVEEYQAASKRIAELEREKERYEKLLISLKHDKSKINFKINSALSEVNNG